MKRQVWEEGKKSGFKRGVSVLLTWKHEGTGLGRRKKSGFKTGVSVLLT